jgi:hypothetical protein
MGMAILYSPFFFMGHLLAGFTGFARDGFSQPYQTAILCAGIFYSITGYYFLRKILLHYFSDLVTGITLCMLYFGTNYFMHCSFVGTNAMSHNYLFTLYAILIWLTIQWHKNFSLKTLVLLAIVSGLTIAARPSEMVCLFVPLLWGIGSTYSIKEKLWLFCKQYRDQTIAFFVILFVIGMPQLLYWKIITGKFLFNSYGDNAGEGFEFAHPFIFEVLLSFRKGWLIYTPLMIFALLGLILMVKKRKEFSYPVLVYFVINFYIVASWSCWWYAESFGQRALIQSYALMSIPLAFFVSTIIENKNQVLRRCLFILFSLFIILNVFQTWQYLNGVIHSSRMTKEAYFSVFGKRDTPADFEKMLLMDRNGGPVIIDGSEYEKTVEIVEEFENAGSGVADPHYSGAHSLKMDSVTIYSPAIEKAYKEITDKDHAKLKVSMWLYSTGRITDNPGSLVITFEHNKFAYGYSASDSEKLTIEPGKWTEISVNYLTPIVRNRKDKLKVYYWHRGKGAVYIDRLKVEVWTPKK